MAFAAREGQPAILYLEKEHLLVLNEERSLPEEHLIDEDTDSPPIYILAIALAP